MEKDSIDQLPATDVVIFGCGLAGARLARALSASFAVTLVDPNDHVEIPMAAPRCLVDPELARRSIIAYGEVAPRAVHLRGRLVEMAPPGGVVETLAGQRCRVGGLVNVLSTGQVFANELLRAPGRTVAERLASYDAFARRIAHARRILIVGGGPIGVEIAGEIVERHPRAAVTLVASGTRILEGTSPGAAAFAHRFLAGKGVTILTGQRITRSSSAPHELNAGAGEAATDAGHNISYDLILWCTGGRPNTAYMRPHLTDALDRHGRIRVTPSLRVIGQSRVFALGDITDLDENKMDWHLEGQVDHALTNIRRVLAGHLDEADLVAHRARTGDTRMAVTLGSRQGVVQLPGLGLVRSPWMTRKAKAAHMLVPKYRRLLRG